LYVGEIQQLQPRGPYLLGGYCMGGTLAFKAAHQVRQEGLEVRLVAIMDAANWAMMPGTSLGDDFYFWS
jgi:thioesterase domain-containing protein